MRLALPRAATVGRTRELVLNLGFLGIIVRDTHPLEAGSSDLHPTTGTGDDAIYFDRTT